MRRFIFVLVAASAALSQGPASAQEVKWRHDYNAARREAEQKNLPLVVDIGTENCYWCNKLEAITFHDPSVADVMNNRFIPLKVDAQRNPALTDALRIDFERDKPIVHDVGHGRVVKGDRLQLIAPVAVLRADVDDQGQVLLL